jgi:hypothetical protein
MSDHCFKLLGQIGINTVLLTPETVVKPSSVLSKWLELMGEPLDCIKQMHQNDVGARLRVESSPPVDPVFLCLPCLISYNGCLFFRVRSW